MRFWWLLIVVFYSGVAVAQQMDCEKFKTGTFLLMDGVSANYTIFRNDSIQVEKSARSTVTTDFYIHWIDNCSYELILKTMHNRPSGLKMPVDTVKLFVKIYKVSGDTCWVETRSNSSKFVIKNRMLKINDLMKMKE